MKFKPIKTPKIGTIKYYKETLKLCLDYVNLRGILGDEESFEAIKHTIECTLANKSLYLEWERDNNELLDT